jgi:hypothetical protein
MMRRPARLSLLASVCAVMAVIATPNAHAASKFDGAWSAVFRTKSGPCQPAYRGAVQVVDGNMEMAAAAGSLSGRVLSNGSVKATGYMGSNYGAARDECRVVPAVEPGALVWKAGAALVFGARRDDSFAFARVSPLLCRE